MITYFLNKPAKLRFFSITAIKQYLNSDFPIFFFSQTNSIHLQDINKLHAKLTIGFNVKKTTYYLLLVGC